MKLSHLSIAILSAITLAACGGGGSSQSLTNTDSGTKPVDQTPVQPPKTDPVVDEKEVIVDPAQTGVVGKLDFKTESSVGTTQYLRKKDSKFDRIDNPSEDTSATSIFGVSVNKQNPYLTNIALARLKDSRYPNMTLVQYLGVNENSVSKYGDYHSLQQQNKHNVQFGEKFGTTDVYNTSDDLENIGDQLTKVKNIIKLYTAKKDLEADQKEQLKQLLLVKADLEALQANIKADKAGEKTGVGLTAVDGDSGLDKWGDLVKTEDKIVTLDKNEVEKSASSSLGPIAPGLVGINLTTGDSRTDKTDSKYNPRIWGTEELSKSSTRIFGRNFSYSDKDSKVLNNPNTYTGATTIVEQTNISNYGDAKDFDDAKTKVTEAIDNSVDKVEWTLAVKPDRLTYVQYGRVTGNLDPIEFEQEDIDAGKALTYKRSDFRIKGADDAVDTYFYRGPDATTVAQMNAVAAKETKPLVYRGHALMYGIDNEFHNTTPDAVPTAFGKTDMRGVGNFVEAQVDLSTGRLDNGFVYNVWHEDKGRAVVRDVLVKFDGNIYGNTVIGEAQRTYNTSDKADFRASFFGPNADELGGSFNSTTYQERYGANGDVWGGVFGAKRDVSGSTLSNQQLGDIPPLTTKSK